MHRPPPRRRAAAALLLAAALLSGCASYAREQLYAAPDAPVAAPEWDGPAPEDVQVRTSDGLTLPGYYWPPIGPNRGIIVVFHGRRFDVARMAGYVQRLARRGRGVLVASYRGFSGNPGSPTEAGLIRDAEAFYAFAEARAGSGGVYAFGHSLGGAVAIQLAAREDLAGLITLGTFSDLAEAAPLYAEWFIPDHWASRAAVHGLAEPVLFIHGAEDDTVTADQARTLYEAACSDTALAIIPEVGHRPNIRLVEPLITGWLNALERGRPADAAALGGAAWETRQGCSAR